MKITLEAYDAKITYETEYDDLVAEQVNDIFNRLLVGIGYPPTVLNSDDGQWQYITEDEIVIKKEELKNDY